LNTGDFLTNTSSGNCDVVVDRAVHILVSSRVDLLDEVFKRTIQLSTLNCRRHSTTTAVSKNYNQGNSERLNRKLESSRHAVIQNVSGYTQNEQIAHSAIKKQLDWNTAVAASKDRSEWLLAIFRQSSPDLFVLMRKRTS
jgi:hypothetical protein